MVRGSVVRSRTFAPWSIAESAPSTGASKDTANRRYNGLSGSLSTSSSPNRCASFCAHTRWHGLWTSRGQSWHRSSPDGNDGSTPNNSISLKPRPSVPEMIGKLSLECGSAGHVFMMVVDHCGLINQWAALGKEIGLSLEIVAGLGVVFVPVMGNRIHAMEDSQRFILHLNKVLMPRSLR